MTEPEDTNPLLGINDWRLNLGSAVERKKRGRTGRTVGFRFEAYNDKGEVRLLHNVNLSPAEAKEVLLTADENDPRLQALRAAAKDLEYTPEDAEWDESRLTDMAALGFLESAKDLAKVGTGSPGELVHGAAKRLGIPEGTSLLKPKKVLPSWEQALAAAPVLGAPVAPLVALGESIKPEPGEAFLGYQQMGSAMESAAEFVQALREGTEGAIEGVLGKIPGINYANAIPWLASRLAAFPLRFAEFPHGEGLQQLKTEAEKNKYNQYAKLAGAMASEGMLTSPMIMGVLAKAAQRPGNPTLQKLYDSFADVWKTNRLKSARQETMYGLGAGIGSAFALEALETAYPNGDAPEWMKTTAMLGGTIVAPAALGTTTGLARSVFTDAPVVNAPWRMIRGAAENITERGMRGAAARGIQNYGSDWRHRTGVFDVVEHLRLALKDGRHMDPNTRLMYTTPQFARHEANILRLQLDSPGGKAAPKAEREAKEALYKNLRMLADYQEGVLSTLSKKGKVGIAIWARHSDAMLKRRDTLAKAFDEAVFKTDLGGKPDRTVDPDTGEVTFVPASEIKTDYEQGRVTGQFEYAVNRKRGFSEGITGQMEPEQYAAITKAYKTEFDKVRKLSEKHAEEALEDAHERITHLRENLPKTMTEQERIDFNRWVGREIDTAYMEVDAAESLLWDAIDGMDIPKVVSTTRDGKNIGPVLLIDDVPIGEYFANKISKLAPGQEEHQSKYLWRLSGKDALVEETVKTGGVETRSLRDQRDTIQQQQRLVTEARAEQTRATRNLSETEEAFNQARLRGREEVPFVEDQKPRELVEAEARFNKANSDLIQKEKTLGTLKEDFEGLLPMGQGVQFEGVDVVISKELGDRSILDTDFKDGNVIGRSPQDIQNVISNLKREIAHESGRSVKNPVKIKAIGSLIDDLQRALTQNFDLDETQLDAAIKMTALKKSLFEKGLVGRLRGFRAAGDPEVDPDKLIDRIATPRSSQRELQAVLTPISVADDSPFTRVYDVDENKFSLELDRDFDLKKYSMEPPPPFKAIRTTPTGRIKGFEVEEGTPVTEANIKIVRDTLWDRFQKFEGPEGFNDKAAANWLHQNKSAIDWLRRATNKETGFEELVVA